MPSESINPFLSEEDPIYKKMEGKIATVQAPQISALDDFATETEPVAEKGAVEKREEQEEIEINPIGGWTEAKAKTLDYLLKRREELLSLINELEKN